MECEARGNPKSGIVSLEEGLFCHFVMKAFGQPMRMITLSSLSRPK